MNTITHNRYRDLFIGLIALILALLTACSSDSATSPPGDDPLTVNKVEVSDDRTTITLTYTGVVGLATPIDPGKIKVYYAATEEVATTAGTEQPVATYTLAADGKGVVITMESALGSGYIKVKISSGAVTDTGDTALAEYLLPTSIKTDTVAPTVASIVASGGTKKVEITFNEAISLVTPWAATEASKYTIKTGTPPPQLQAQLIL